MKKLLTFLLCVVLLMGAVGLTACGSQTMTQNTVSNTKTAGRPVTQLSVQGVSSPKLGTILKRYTAGDDEDEGQARATRRLTATVEPATALNKQVDYSVSWASDAEHIAEDVSEYVTVEQDSDGSADATVSCYKGFDDDTIIITVVTREGGFRAFCNVIFSGLISELSISSLNGLTLTSDTKPWGESYTPRTDYYELGVNRTYDFDINVDSVFDEITYDLSVDIGYSDTDFYLRDSQGVSLSSTAVSLSDLILDLFEITLEDTSLRIVIKDKLLLNCSDAVYYDKHNTPYYFANKFDDGNSGSDIRANEAREKEAYFTVTVTDSKSGLSDSFKFWITSTAAGLSVSSDTIEF